MAKFLKRVLIDLMAQEVNPSDCLFILPNKRAGTFLKNEFAKLLSQPAMAPQIVSIEEFVQNLSQLRLITNESLLLNFYTCYCAVNKSHQGTLEEFIGWAQPLLQDFNEIDRHLIPADQILAYLSNIKELDHWSTSDAPTDLISAYLDFWKLVPLLYNHLTKDLLEKGQAYQGLVYREAVEHIESYIQESHQHHVFVGFNALNTAEETVIQELLQNNLASIYWDISEHFIADQHHLAGMFIRSHLKQWPALQQKEVKWLDKASYHSSKEVKAISAVKQIGQAQSVGHLVNELLATNQALDRVAIVLADEHLLMPVLHALPQQVQSLNVTMGLPLTQVPLVQLLRQLLKIQKKNAVSLYYKDVLAVINHPTCRLLIEDDLIQKIKDSIHKQNRVFISLEWLDHIAGGTHEILHLLFYHHKNKPLAIIQSFQQLVFKIKEALNASAIATIQKEFAFRCYTILNQLEALLLAFDSINSVDVLQAFFEDLIRRETVDFRGEPLKGLQIMGMLESRVLDFDTVILVSANEGILPAGKSHNSYLPFDVKKEFGLPTYQEKDAIYAYHFFRLLQHAQHMYLIYNIEPDSFGGGELSRFILQIEAEGIHEVKRIASHAHIPATTKHLKSVIKSDSIQKRIIKRLTAGISPSALLTYIRNPIDFYNQYVLGIRRFEEVEETVAANTLGTIVHEALKTLYEPFVGQPLTHNSLKTIQSKIPSVVASYFDHYYNKDNYKSGKNLLLFNVAKRYISSMVHQEIQAINQGNSIEIVALEFDAKTQFMLPGHDIVVTLRGQVDRMDIYNGVMRIIDYKTGAVDTSELSIFDWDDIGSDYKKYGKSFQVLCYCYMLYSSDKITLPVSTGIISFKNMQHGFMAFGIKEHARSRTKDTFVNKDMMTNFEAQLIRCLQEILGQPEFIEKEV